MIEMARRNVWRSDHDKYWHCAIVFRHGRPLSIGVNTGWNHAERDAIMAVKEPRRCNVLSVRFSRLGQLRMARPCEECRELLASKGVRWMVYSNENGELEEETLWEKTTTSSASRSRFSISHRFRRLVQDYWTN